MKTIFILLEVRDAKEKNMEPIWDAAAHCYPVGLHVILNPELDARIRRALIPPMREISWSQILGDPGITNIGDGGGSGFYGSTGLVFSCVSGNL